MTQHILDDAQVREAAYLLWLDEGQPVGKDQEHWLKAVDALTPAAPKKKAAAKQATANTRLAKAKEAVKDLAKTVKADAKPKAKAAAAKKPRTAKAKES